jgi:hypothetical protein
VTTLKSSVEQKQFFEKKYHAVGTKNKYRSLLADTPEIGISKISEDAKKEKCSSASSEI